MRFCTIIYSLLSIIYYLKCFPLAQKSQTKAKSGQRHSAARILLLYRYSSVHAKRLTGDERSVLAGEKADGGGNILR